MTPKNCAIMLSLCAGSLSAAAQVELDTFFSDDFERGLNRSYWHGDTTLGFDRNLGNNFAGRHGNRQQAILRLTLPDLPDYMPHDDQPGDDSPGAEDDPRNDDHPIFSEDDQIPERPANTQPGYVLEFDLYIIDSWDGFEPSQGLDRFTVSVGGNTLFDEFFSNHSVATGLGAQTFEPREGDTFRTQLAFNYWDDSIYRDITLAFTEDQLPSLDVDIVFEAFGLQAINDESWGIDNVRLSTVNDINALVPAPSGLAALAGGLGLALRRRRC